MKTALLIKKWQQQGKIVAMVGDVSTTGSIGAGPTSASPWQSSDIAMDVAKMTIISSDLTKVPKAIHLSKQTAKVIKQISSGHSFTTLSAITIAAGVFVSVQRVYAQPMIAVQQCG
jgi:Cu2+-exporting ATPase